MLPEGRSPALLQLLQQLLDSIQPRPQIVGRQAKTDPEVLVQPEKVARHDKGALFLGQAHDDLGRVGLQVVAWEGDGGGSQGGLEYV